MKCLPKQIVWFALIASLLAGLAIGAAIRAGLNEKGSTEQSERADIRIRSDWRVQNQEQAIRQVVEVVGVPEDLLPGITAQLVTVAEDDTPFLSQQIAGRPLWQVVINKWRLHLDSAIPGFEDRYERTFDVLVDPVNGNILKITSDWPEGIPRMAPEPSAWAAEEKMGRSGLEKYHSFPDAKPLISFLEALNVLQREGVGSPLVAKQIIGHYVVQSRMAREPKPVWAITLRGIEMPWHGGPRGTPPTVLTRMRNIVHAETGEWLSASNQPALGSVHVDDRSSR